MVTNWDWGHSRQLRDRWVFRVVLPKLVGERVLRKINLFISDGDSQETSQLDLAIKENFPHVQRVLCGWHIVEKGWQKYCPGERSVELASREGFKKLMKLVKNGFIP
jgi:hypothetical protein